MRKMATLLLMVSLVLAALAGTALAEHSSIVPWNSAATFTFNR